MSLLSRMRRAPSRDGNEAGGKSSSVGNWGKRGLQGRKGPGHTRPFRPRSGVSMLFSVK